MNKKILCLAIVLILIVFTAFSIVLHRDATEFIVTEYSVPTEVTSPTRIVHLTDLHSVVYGEGNEEIVSAVLSASPDLILMTGDMLSGEDDGPEVVCDLIGRLSEIAPVYYGYGNHEKEWEARTGDSLAPALTAAGATVLDCAYVDVTVCGTDLRIGGYHGYYRQPHMFPISEDQKQAELSFCDDFEDTDRYKILLCHIPTAWLDWGYINCFPVDLVLSGHYHGGQIRLFGRGLYAPYVGLFPEYTRGIFQGETATCILSAGIGTEQGIPRINNSPEILSIDLIPEN